MAQVRKAARLLYLASHPGLLVAIIIHGVLFGIVFYVSCLAEREACD